MAGASACNHPLVARPSLGLSTGPVLAPHGRFQNRLTEERFRLQSGSTRSGSEGEAGSDAGPARPPTPIITQDHGPRPPASESTVSWDQAQGSLNKCFQNILLVVEVLEAFQGLSVFSRGKRLEGEDEAPAGQDPASGPAASPYVPRKWRFHGGGRRLASGVPRSSGKRPRPWLTWIFPLQFFIVVKYV